jgi:hypothetical protein
MSIVKPKSVKQISSTAVKSVIALVNEHLKAKNFNAKVQEIHFLPRNSPSASPRSSALETASEMDCPPPKKIRRICKLNNGTWECEDHCV